SATIPHARVLGGGSTTNGMLYVRGNRRDFDHWAALGNPSWDYQSVLYYFKKFEDYQGHKTPEAEEYHGRGGPIGVTPEGKTGKLARAFLHGGLQLGYDVRDPNGEEQMGFATTDYTVCGGIRCSTAWAYLRPAASRPNLHILHSATVLKVLTARARREVIVSAGALASPKLLMLSGVGAQYHLDEHHVKVVADVPGVGQNLQDHLGVYGLAWTTKTSSPSMDNTFTFPAVAQYVHHRKGPWTKPVGEYASAWVKTRNDGDPYYPDVQFYLSPAVFSMDMGLFLPYIYNFDKSKYLEYTRPLFNHQGFTVNLFLLRPKSIKVLMALGNTTSLRKQFQAKFHDKPVPGCEGEAFGSHKYWACYVQHMASSFWHPTSSCKMGPSSDPLAVVNPRLRVHRVSGLRVVDASVMPIIVSGNTNAATLMIAEKASDFIKEDWNGHG
ncbi:Glucose dehydrogenase [FAD quinone]-like 6, partial [Homarus americanus]